jgi:hypothetical protein
LNKFFVSFKLFNYKGKYYEIKSGYECCNNNYLPKPENITNRICCGGLFLNKITDFKCCGYQYVYVPKGQICCSNTDDITNEITIDIGYGERKSH